MFRKRERRVAILGCGPAGLFAAHAFREAGWRISILSRKRRSEMFGAQYLHAEIPGLPAFSANLQYTLNGTVEGYAKKVYGGTIPPEAVSPAHLLGLSTIWDIRAAYYGAWDRYAAAITSMQVDPSIVHSVKQSFDLVVSAIPAPALCNETEGRHSFESEKAWAIGDAPERGVFCPINTEPFTVRCNGEDVPAWYRASNVFGYQTAEWPRDNRPPLEGVAEVTKPLRTNCDCHLGKNFVRVGRYGTWTKGVLSHEAYFTAKEMAR